MENLLKMEKKKSLIYDRVIFHIFTVFSLLFALLFFRITHIILFIISVIFTSLLILFYTKKTSWENTLSLIRGESEKDGIPSGKEYLYFALSFIIVFSSGVIGFVIYYVSGNSTNVSFNSINIKNLIDQLFVVSMIETYFLISFLVIPTKEVYKPIQAAVTTANVIFFVIYHNNLKFFVSALLLGSATVIVVWKYKYWLPPVLAHMILNVFIAPFFVLQFGSLIYPIP